MKWPKTITLVRHGQSEYNVLRAKKEADPLYQEFKREFEKLHTSTKTRLLAEAVSEKYALDVSDYNTPLTCLGIEQSELTGRNLLLSGHPTPDIIFVSPYLRTRGTFNGIRTRWTDLKGVKVVYDDRIREQEHGLSTLYNDWRVFQTFHPEQKKFFERSDSYWYQYPQGESVPEVRDRIRLFTDMLIREYAEQHVLIITHHLTIFSFRANYERLSPEEFIYLDKNEKPINCGVTMYEGNPERGTNGKLELKNYNLCFWDK